MKRSEWDELYPEGTTEWNMRKLSRNTLKDMKMVAAMLEVSLGIVANDCMRRGVDELLAELASREE